MWKRDRIWKKMTNELRLCDVVHRLDCDLVAGDRLLHYRLDRVIWVLKHRFFIADMDSPISYGLDKSVLVRQCTVQHDDIRHRSIRCAVGSHWVTTASGDLLSLSKSR